MPVAVVEIRPAGPAWQVGGSVPPVLLPTPDQAWQWAVRCLEQAGGGRLRTLGADGRVLDERWIPAPPDERRQEQAEQIAEAADALTGRAPEGTELLIDKGKDVDADILVPRRWRGRAAVTTTHRHISVGAAWIGIVTLVAGGGTFAGVVGPALRSAAGKATLGAYLDFGTAFFATFSMSLAIALTVLAFRRRVGWWWQGVIFVVTALLACYASLWVGLADVDPDDLLRLPANAPAIKAVQFLGIYFDVFGPVPFLCGLGVGAITGNLAYRLLAARRQRVPPYEPGAPS